MTRAGVSTVAMAAAVISAGALGYAVIWSYGEHECTATLAPLPHEQAPIASVPPPAQEMPVAPPSVAATEPARAPNLDQPRASTKLDDAVAKVEAAPERLD